ncbi:prepilin-type N-terminal cleavage/methylation domain-containing protein [Paenibacillaceae bacterium WGS1546]|uniref:prepilin-type N-terminal cleavage/methylation domain-containing protein n=1 Tax=Cohnella sp. WGS1546 TaxID=3366810 RepID=UPI00372D7605
MPDITDPSPIRNERGATLIELLTALLLFSMVAAILYSFMFMGISMYKRVSVETQMRNQADTLYSRVMTELRDAIYVKQGEPSPDGGVNDGEIVFVKRAAGGAPINPEDPPPYIETYMLKMDESGMSVTAGDGATVLKRFELTERFKLDRTRPDGALKSNSGMIAESHQLLDLSLRFIRADANEVARIERSSIEIQSKIPLIRLE